MRTTTGSKVLSSRDVEFLVFEWLDAESLTARKRFAAHSLNTFEAALELSQAVAEAQFAPHNAISDQQEPTFDGEAVSMVPEVGEALSAFADTGLLAGAMDETWGGIALPHVVHQACFAWFQAANIATAAYPMLTMANANLLLAHASREQVDRFVPPMLDGRFFGTMCLSEPQAGSSLADVATRAVRSEDGTYRLFGSKMWISGGDHELGENIVHLVLARVVGAPPGVKGLSLFIVPKVLVAADGTPGERNDVVLAGLNHKMGYRGTTNALLNFGEGSHRPHGEAGAVGYLVGDEASGIAYMFHMMNEARIGVGAGAVALGYTGYLHALDYARTRLQGRSLSDKHAAEAVPIIDHADVRRMLLASKSYVEGGLALVLYAARLLDEQQTAPEPEAREHAGVLLDVLTPIVKSWPAQWCLLANDHAIQVHGGYGYSREYPVEQFYRDNRLNLIHEGTQGIQAQDLLGRKVVLGDGVGLRALDRAIRDCVARAGGAHGAMAAALDAARRRLMRVTRTVWASGDAERATTHATTYLEAAGHVVIAWMWLEQVVAAGDRPGAFYDGKRAAARYFLTHELPRTDAQFDLLERDDGIFLDLDPSCL